MVLICLYAAFSLWGSNLQKKKTKDKMNHLKNTLIPKNLKMYVLYETCRMYTIGESVTFKEYVHTCEIFQNS